MPKFKRQPRAHFPLVLRINSGVRIGLCDPAIGEGLREPGVVVGAGKEICQRRKRITAAISARIRDGIVVVEIIDAHTNRVRADLIRQVVHNFAQLIQTRGWRSGERPEGAHTGNTDGWSDPVGGRSRQIAVGELATGLIDKVRTQREILVAATVWSVSSRFADAVGALSPPAPRELMRQHDTGYNGW